MFGALRDEVEFEVRANKTRTGQTTLFVEGSAPYKVVEVGGSFGEPRVMAKYLEDIELYLLAERLRNFSRTRVAGYIDGLSVVKDARRNGLGRMAIRKWIVEARARGVYDIYLWAYPYEGNVSTPLLVSFYESLGFDVLGQEEDHGDGITGKIMMRLPGSRKLPQPGVQMPLLGGY